MNPTNQRLRGLIMPPTTKLATVLTTVLALSLNGCATIKDWTSKDTGEPPTPLTTITPVVSFGSVWQAQIGDGSDDKFLKLPPLVTSSRVVASSADGTVAAFDRRSGKQLWRTDTGGQLGSAPGGDDELVVVGDSEGTVIAVNASNGAELWRTPLSSEILSAPGVAATTVVVRTTDGRLYGLDRNSGEQRWVYNQTEPVLTLRGTSAPQVFANGIIAGMDNGSLVTVLGDTGQRVWTTKVANARGSSELQRIVDIDGDPVILDDAVYAVSYQGNIAAIDLRSGEPIWRRKMSSSKGLGVDDINVYVTDADSIVHALSRSGGASVWTQEGLRARSVSAPEAVGAGAAVGDFEGYLHLLAADDGRFIGRTRIGSAAILAKPVFVDGILYVINAKGRLQALSVGGQRP